MIDQTILNRVRLLGKAFYKDESGATAIEYGLIAALIAIGLIVGLTALGKDNAERLRCTGRAVDGARLGKLCQDVGVG